MLRKAESAVDLWPAIEAAQYGRVVQRDEDELTQLSDLEGVFVEALLETLEGWEGGAAEQAALMRKLETDLSSFVQAGGSVHWIVVQRTVAVLGGGSVAMPIALFRIGASRAPALETTIPMRLAVEDDLKPDPMRE